MNWILVFAHVSRKAARFIPSFRTGSSSKVSCSTFLVIEYERKLVMENLITVHFFHQLAETEDADDDAGDKERQIGFLSFRYS
jgi:hypothetical protein